MSSKTSPKRTAAGRKTAGAVSKLEVKKKKNIVVEEKDDDLAVKPVNPYIDFILGLTFIFLCIYLVLTLSNKSTYYMLGFFMISLVVVAFGK